jgi:hypothetical protein
MNRRYFALLLAALMAGLVAPGCGKSGPKQLEVTGTVKFDGKEVAEGDITFIPEDKSVGAEGGKIKDGKYTIKARIGKNKVQIFASRPVPGKKGPMGEDLIEQYIPEKYNIQTELSVDAAEGKTEHNFDLKK